MHAGGGASAAGIFSSKNSREPCKNPRFPHQRPCMPALASPSLSRSLASSPSSNGEGEEEGQQLKLSVIMIFFLTQTAYMHHYLYFVLLLLEELNIREMLEMQMHNPVL